MQGFHVLHVPSFAKSLITFLFKVGEASIKTTTFFGKLSDFEKKNMRWRNCQSHSLSYKHYTFSEFHQISLSIPQALPTARQVAVTPIPTVSRQWSQFLHSMASCKEHLKLVHCLQYLLKVTKVSKDKSGSRPWKCFCHIMRKDQLRCPDRATQLPSRNHLN